MAWVEEPEPTDDTVIWEATADSPAFTWGDHKRMEETLRHLEATDPMVKKARERLDAAIEELGIEQSKPRTCEYCGVQEFSLHKLNCPDAVNDTGREAGGYQYLNDRFEVVWTTSTPRTDEFALRHFRNIQLMNEDQNICYILRRELHGTEFKMMPFRFDRTQGEDGEVIPIVQ